MFTLRDTPGNLAELLWDGQPTPLAPLDGHALNDLEWAIAERKAGGRRCGARRPGEEDPGSSYSLVHICGLIPGPHYAGIHSCRACTTTWENP